MHNKVLVTPRIKEEISNIHFLFINELIEDMVQRDYLQVFNLRASAEGLQEIEHTQGSDNSYKKTYKFYTTRPVNGTIYVTIEKDYSVMMFSDEY